MGVETLLGVALFAGKSYFEAQKQKKAKRRVERAQRKFYEREREAVGVPEALEPGIYEEFIETAGPRLEAEMAERGLSVSTDIERRQLALETQAQRYARQAALQRWQAQAGVAQRQVEQAYGTAYVGGPEPEEAFWGGVVKGAAEPIAGWLGERMPPVISGPTPGITTPAPAYPYGQEWGFAWA